MVNRESATLSSRYVLSNPPGDRFERCDSIKLGLYKFRDFFWGFAVKPERDRYMRTTNTTKISHKMLTTQTTSIWPKIVNGYVVFAVVAASDSVVAVANTLRTTVVWFIVVGVWLQLMEMKMTMATTTSSSSTYFVLNDDVDDDNVDDDYDNDDDGGGGGGGSLG